LAIHAAIEHVTTYRFDRALRLAPHVVRLRPAPHTRTPVLAYALRVEPGEHFVNWQQDPFGNYQARLVFPEPARELRLAVDMIVDLTVINPFDFFVEESAERYPFTYADELARDLAPYLVPDAAGPRLAEWLAGVGRGSEPIVDFLVRLNQRVEGCVAYTTRMEHGVQTPEETLEKALGSCRDSGWLLVQALRHLGLAARFVSGYLVQLAADEPPLDGPAGPRVDFTDLHAWAEVYVPGAGWIGLDPTSGLLAGEGHIPLACTVEPSSAAPVTGAVEPGEVTLEFSNMVRRVREDPRVTKPYSDAQWGAIDALGDRVDAVLAAGDVRLTMGGEPTFVAVDDYESEEWTTGADGATKRRRAWDLITRLAADFAPGGVVALTQGKWYPGEPLPRWQLAVLWRVDGTPLWRDHSLFADPWMPGDAPVAAAEPFVRAIATALGIPAACVFAAHEADAPEPTGWAIPLYHRSGGTGWLTSRWNVPAGGASLVPGDSPMGLRLPLAELAPRPADTDPDRSPFAVPSAVAGTGVAEVVPPEGMPTTALCVQVRDGRMHVFLPPLVEHDHAAALLGIVEDVASEARRTIVVEGYLPPADPRTTRLVVTTDPGVIEVNVQPARSWRELVDVTSGVHDAARVSQLGTETFALDGAHSGTGGGNHITLGGPTPADSPLLRRPDLLRSLITYWQHHPSLSYLFSGRFVGPTSQAPRIDESRDDLLYELEIAFGEMERLGERVRPWIVDRLLRNLLVDVTGNTHRAEFCIDKLFAPDSERGRLGLLELRAFEMPPHPRMALVQALLVRALVARCWNAPYAGPLTRWGTALHDRFLLPWYVAQDLAEVLADLRVHGLPVDDSWFAPFLEFRFPRLGSTRVAGVGIELRAAIEPWLVLGEEVTATTTARYVDSSVERVQVTVDGMNAARHVLTCNRRPVPLQSTGVAGTAVAGVRYKAWAPPTALHPTIRAQGPLVFDLVDRVNGRSLGGCTYHVSHPGGRAYDRFPVNANEAEARRVSRFDPSHTPGSFDVTALAIHEPAEGGEYPRTLDLRRPSASV
jgi:uncharacterized protein (DUF2126 family)/transglutaminase-like putative cysteine protease